MIVLLFGSQQQQKTAKKQLPKKELFRLLRFFVSLGTRLQIISSRIAVRDELSLSRISFFPLHEGRALRNLPL